MKSANPANSLFVLCRLSVVPFLLAIVCVWVVAEVSVLAEDAPNQPHSILVKNGAEEPVTAALDEQTTAKPAADASILEPAEQPILELVAPQNAAPAPTTTPATPAAPAKTSVVLPASEPIAKPAAQPVQPPAFQAQTPKQPAGEANEPAPVPGQMILIDDQPLSSANQSVTDQPVANPGTVEVPAANPPVSGPAPEPIPGQPVPAPMAGQPVPPTRPVPPAPPTQDEWNTAVQAFEQTIRMMEEKRNQAARAQRHDLVRYLNQKISLARQKLVIMKDEYHRAVRISNIERQLVALEYAVSMGDRAAINRERALMNQRRVELEQSQRQQIRSQELSRKMIEMGKPPLP